MAGVRRWKRERDDDAAVDKYEFNDGSDDESRDRDRSERLEDLFDLAPRFEVLTLSKKAWADKAIALALAMCRRNEREIPWWYGSSSSPVSALPNVKLKADTGVHPFQVDPTCCQNLYDFLEDPSSYDEEGWLLLAGTQWPGYSSYPYVHAVHHLPVLQERKTVRVASMKKVNHILRGEPLVNALVVAVRSALGLPQPSRCGAQPAGKCIRAMHFLKQDESQQASFSWHSDAEDLKQTVRRDLMTTVIVQLTKDEASGMRMWGCLPHIYIGQGSAVAFQGAAMHESLPRVVPARVPVWKVALFFA